MLYNNSKTVIINKGLTMTEEYTIEDLENHSGIPTRTLHYYMQLGLLPGPDKRGKYASYSQEHIDRLDLILILKEMHLP